MAKKLLCVVLLNVRVNWDTRAIGGGQGNLLQVDALPICRLDTQQLVEQCAVVLSQLLSVEGCLTDHCVQVSCLVNAEGDLAALNVCNCLSNISGNGTGLRVRHQTTWAQNASYAANLSHLVWGCNSNVEVQVASVDCLKKGFGADDVCACCFCLCCLLAFSEDSNANVLTSAVWRRYGAANQLVCLTWVNAQAEGNVNGCVVVLGGGFLSQLCSLDWTVETVLVNELCSGLVCLGVLAHLNQILVMSWWIGVVFNGPKLALPHEVVYSGAPSTVMPMERAVPAMIAAPASMSRALRSFFLVSAISLH